MTTYFYHQIKPEYQGDEVAIIERQTDSPQYGFLRCGLDDENFKNIIKAMKNPPKRLYLGINSKACFKIHDNPHISLLELEELDGILLNPETLS